MPKNEAGSKEEKKDPATGLEIIIKQETTNQSGLFILGIKALKGINEY